MAATETAGPGEFIRNRFVPTSVYACERGGLHTRLCVYNYYSELFPDVKTGATAYMWFFDQSGREVGRREEHLGFRGQLRFEVSEVGEGFEGIAALSLVPDTLPEFKPQRVGTGYYALYYDDAGHADFSHEWEAMKFEPGPSPPWICLVRPMLFPDTQLVVMSSYFGADGEAGRAEWVARLRNAHGAVVAEKQMPALPPRGCARLPVNEVFPEARALAEREGTLSVEVQGSNIQGPFTYVRGPGGDINIHHFC
ncbi:MAG: hypothetical protein QOH49_1455 [Acidobacteriota bacterium]|jgi:hypothetical protein|nr:hypothetical protein [Acidobacteriota bacterium]